LVNWNGWTGWAPEIVADYIYTINIQRAWSIERQKKKSMASQHPLHAYHTSLKPPTTLHNIQVSFDTVHKIKQHLHQPKGLHQNAKRNETK